MAPTTATPASTPAAAPSVPAAGADPAIAAKGYAHPEVLVTTEWLAEHLDDPKVRIIESDEDVLLYDTGHIPGAQKIDWHTDLNDAVDARLRHARAVPGAAPLEAASTSRRPSSSTATRTTGGRRTRSGCSSCSASRTRSVLDGGRSKWEQEGRPIIDRRAAVSARRSTWRQERNDATIRAFQADVARSTRRRRSRSSTFARRTSSRARSSHMPDYPQEGALRGGHIPGAKSVPWARAANPDGTFKTADGAARDLREGAGVSAGRRRDRVLPHRRALVPHAGSC